MTFACYSAWQTRHCAFATTFCTLLFADSVAQSSRWSCEGWSCTGSHTGGYAQTIHKKMVIHKRSTHRWVCKCSKHITNYTQVVNITMVMHRSTYRWLCTGKQSTHRWLYKGGQHVVGYAHQSTYRWLFTGNQRKYGYTQDVNTHLTIHRLSTHSQVTIHRWVYNRQHAGVYTHVVNLQVRGYAQGDKTSSYPSVAGPELCGETDVKSKNSLINLQESWAVPSLIVQKQSTQIRAHSGYCLRKQKKKRLARSSRSILMQNVQIMNHDTAIATSVYYYSKQVLS